MRCSLHYYYKYIYELRPAVRNDATICLFYDLLLRRREQSIAADAYSGSVAIDRLLFVSGVQSGAVGVVHNAPSRDSTLVIAEEHCGSWIAARP